MNDYLAHQEELVKAIESRDSDGLLQLLANCQASGKKLLTPLH